MHINCCMCYDSFTFILNYCTMQFLPIAFLRRYGLHAINLHFMVYVLSCKTYSFISEVFTGCTELYFE